MRHVSVREANENVPRLIALAAGETVVITKDGKPVAKLSPQAQDRTQDPDWYAAHARLVAYLNDTTRPRFHVGTITEDDLYGDDA